jgi:predicted Ser/Thr protein kinase
VILPARAGGAARRPTLPTGRSRATKCSVADLTVGSLFAGYRIEGIAGRGGMGVVYRARDQALDRVVALKFIAADLASTPGFRERFTTESRTAASLDHPNVIPIYQAGEHEGTLYLAMRYVDGEDLRSALQRERRLQPERAARVVAQIAAALDAAHARGLVHRDVKPANVLVTPDGHAYLTDFGLTKRVVTDPEATQTGQLVGSLNYVAPEQIRGEPVSPRTDIYGLGCLLFHVLTGRVPFPLEGNEAKLWAHVSEPPPLATAVTPALPAAFDGVIVRAMQKRPEDRFQSAGELGRAAAAAAAGELQTQPRDVAGPARTPTPYTPRDYNRALILNALSAPFGVVVAAGVVVAGILLGALSFLLPLAIVLYIASAARTYFDDDVQKGVLAREGASHHKRLEKGRPERDLSEFSPRLADLMARALERDARIRAAIDRAELPYEEVSEEVDRFLATMWQTAARAELLSEGLRDSPPEAVARRLQEVQAAGDPAKAELVDALSQQLAVQQKMERQLVHFYDQMEQVLVELDTVRGHLITVSASTEADNQERLADDVRDLREEMGAVAEGMAAAYSRQPDPHGVLEREAG